MSNRIDFGGSGEHAIIRRPWDEKDEDSDQNIATETTGLLASNKSSRDPSHDDVVLVNSPPAGLRPRGYVPVEVVSFLYFFNIILAVPHTQFYIYHKISEQYGGVNSSESIPCEHTLSNSSANAVEKRVQSETSTVIMYLTFACTFSGVLPTLLLGSLTDRYGRKMASILAITGSTVKQAIFTAVFVLDANVNYLLIGSIVEGACGYSGGILVSLFAAVADITSPGKERAFRITSLEASIYLSSAISQGVAGVWIKHTGFLIPLYTMMGISLLNMGVVVFLLPETRRRSLTPLTLSESFKALKRSVLFYTRDTPDRRRWKLQVALFAFFVSFATSTVFTNILNLYLLKSPFCWSIVMISLYTAITSLLDFGSVLLLTRCLGHMVSDINIAVLGSMSCILFLLLTGLAYNDFMIYIAGVLGIFSASVAPMLRSVMSRLVSSEDQGAMFSSISVSEMISGAFLGLAATAGYSASLDSLPGLVFLSYSGLMACVSILLGFLSCALKKQRSETTIIFVKG